MARTALIGYQDISLAGTSETKNDLNWIHIKRNIK
jgi:hypothetical protein